MFCPGVILLLGTAVVVVSRRKGATDVLNLVGVSVTLPWWLWVAFAGVGHCPQGDPETWTIGHLLNAFQFWLALPLLLGSLDQRRWRWTVPLAVITPLLVEIADARRVIFGGEHLCGSYRGAPDYTEFWATQYYPAMWTYALVLSAVALLPYLRRSAPPDSPPLAPEAPSDSHP